MDMENLLFLDIDGVVNTLMIWDTPQGIDNIFKDGFYFDLCHSGDERVSNKQAVLWLSKLCLDYDLSIVITSSWLIGSSYTDIAEALYNTGLSRNIQVIGGIGKRQPYSRGCQIEDWFNEVNLDPDKINMVILDDDTDMVGFTKDFSKYLVKCDTFVGFTHNEYVKASELLDEQLDK